MGSEVKAFSKPTIFFIIVTAVFIFGLIIGASISTSKSSTNSKNNIFTNSQVNHRIDSLKYRIENDEILLHQLNRDLISLRIKGLIDGQYGIALEEQGFQSLKEDLGISISKIEKHLNGVEIYGYVINKSSIVYGTLNLSVEVNESKNDVSIYDVLPGGSKKFMVYVPDVPSDSVKLAYFSVLKSEIRYKKGN